MHAGENVNHDLLEADATIQATRSVCLECRTPIPATLVERDGDVFLRKDCPRCGVAEGLFFRDAGLFRALNAHHATDRLAPESGFSFDWEPYRRLCTTLAVDVTERCNFRCPDCFAAAGTGSDDPPADRLLSWLPNIRPGDRPPNLALVGGESLLRDDLPAIVRGIRQAGIVPRLNSNGLLLDDESVLTRLAEAGLRWVILQFDGFSPDVSRRFRGEDHVDLKRRVIEKLSRRGFLIHFAVMVERGQNDGEMAEILRYALRTPAVRRVSFYPRAQVGRGRKAVPRTHLADLLSALATGSGGQVTAMDILAFQRIWARLFRLTGSPLFRNRRCQTPFLVAGDGARLVPLNRAGELLTGPASLLRAVASIRNLLDFDSGKGPAHVLPVNIEVFYDTEWFDLDAARNCHHIYMTPSGYIPFCIYNSFHREHARAGEGC